MPQCTSFASGTLVAIGTGELRPIEAIAPGDAVLGVETPDHAARPFAVNDTISRETDVLVEIDAGGTRVEATPEHPFYVATRGWVEAGDLHAGDPLVTADGEEVPVRSVRQERRRATVHNISVATAQTYFATTRRFLVHNQVIRCLLSKVTAPKSIRAKGEKAVQKWLDERKPIIQKYGDRMVSYEDLPTGRRTMDFEEYAFEVNGQKAIADLSAEFGTKQSSRPQHFNYADKLMSTIFGFNFSRTGGFRFGSRFWYGTWHHHPDRLSIAFVPRDLHQKFGHTADFTGKYVKPFQRE
jgi:hypothetical protein